jgi:hypothetical protein
MMAYTMYTSAACRPGPAAKQLSANRKNTKDLNKRKKTERCLKGSVYVCRVGLFASTAQVYALFKTTLAKMAIPCILHETSIQSYVLTTQGQFDRSHVAGR